MDELASFLTPESRVDVKLLALQQVDGRILLWECKNGSMVFAESELFCHLN